ncbi:MAG: hypothetical protein HOV83_29495 [Catenulispora sp.]|nr:hypothetical protein [Catenulispora sp.]
MKRALTLASGFAVGYVVGTRAGHERYEQLKQKMHEIGQQPSVIEVKHNLQERVDTAAKTVADKVTDTVSTLAKKTRPDSDGTSDLDDARDRDIAPVPAAPGAYPAAPTGVVPGSSKKA